MSLITQEKGLATEASVAVLHYGFEVAGLDCMCAGADPSNEASFRVMKRLEMKFARRTTINELVADYYVTPRAEDMAG